MEEYTLVYKYEEVIIFLKHLDERCVIPINFKKFLRQVDKIEFEQNMKATIHLMQSDNGSSIAFTPNGSRTVTLRKIRIKREHNGKSNSYRCYIILDKISCVACLVAIYDHKVYDSFPPKALEKLKKITGFYMYKIEEQK